MDFNFILLFIDVIHLQLPDFLGGERQALGSDDPIVKGLVISMFAVSGFGIMLNLFNSAVRKKMVDQVKLKRIMKETKGWQKERMAAMRSKDQAKIAELGKKSSYMNKMSMEMMQMRMYLTGEPEITIQDAIIPDWASNSFLILARVILSLFRVSSDIRLL